MKKQTLKKESITYTHGIAEVTLHKRDGVFEAARVHVKYGDGGTRSLLIEDSRAIPDIGNIMREIVLDHPDGIS